MLSRRVMAALLAAPLLLTTACGDAERLQPSDLAAASKLPPIEATINPPKPKPVATTKAPAATSAPAGEAPAEPAAGSGTEIKATVANQFAPATLQVKVGTEVTWLNEAGFHTVTGGADVADPASPIGNHTLDVAGKTVKVMFDKPGSYKFFCTPHLALGMKGEVVVA